MSAKLWRAFDFIVRNVPFYKPRESTHNDIVDVDLAIDESLTVLDSERLLVDDAGAVVGMTAIIDDEELKLTGGKLPSGYYLFFTTHSETSVG
jgi:hypothetical protein